MKSGKDRKNKRHYNHIIRKSINELLYNDLFGDWARSMALRMPPSKHTLRKISRGRIASRKGSTVTYKRMWVVEDL